MLQKVENVSLLEPGGGLVTYPNFFQLKPNQTPNCMNVIFGLGGTVSKRFGSTTAGTAVLASTAGWGSFNFGAGFASGEALRWLVVSAATGVFASSNRGVSYLTIATDRSQYYQNFERSKTLLVLTSDTYDRVLYWAGSVATFALSLGPGSAPAAKYALDYSGFLLLMNDSGSRNRISYSDNNTFTTDPWTNTFSLPTELDDEITGSTILYKSAYVFTKFRTYRISHVGGNPDFAYLLIKNWGAVPRTIKKATIPGQGEVVFVLGWDKKLRVFDGADDQVISDSIELDNRQSPVFMEGININAIQKSFAVVDENEQVYKLWVAMAPSTETTHCINFNLRTLAFYAYDAQPFQTAIMAESSNSRRLFAIERTGSTRMLNTMNTDIGVAISDYYDSPFLYRQTPSTVTKDHFISLFFTATSSGILYYQDRTGFNNTFSQVRDTISFADTSNTVQIQKRIDIPLTQNVYQFRLTSSGVSLNAATPWGLNRIDVTGANLGTGKAP